MNWFFSSSKRFSVETFDGEFLFDIKLYKMSQFKKTHFSTYFTYDNDSVTLSTCRGEVYTLQNPSLDNEYNETNIMKVEDLSQLLKSTRAIGEENEFITSYLNFIDGIEDTEEISSNRSLHSNVGTLSELKLRSATTARFLGFDNNGNLYWNDSYQHIKIFNSNKQLIDAFKFDVPSVQIDPVVHPNGDVYFLSIYEKGSDLFRV